jgi:NDP-sugar pyrophosphorylase family protein
MSRAVCNLSEIDVLILAGGLGTRLQSVVSDRPKSLAPVHDKAFIDLLLEQLIGQGLNRFILCVGHFKEQIIEHLKDRPDCQILFSTEDEPLGTGGALKNAYPFIRSDPFFALNGDSFLNVSFDSLLTHHKNKNGFATFSVARKKVSKEYGTIVFDENKRILNFQEKVDEGGGYVNGGVYCFNRELFSTFPKKSKFSLEYDVFPKLVTKECFVWEVDSSIYDIGTPERYKTFVERKAK